MHTRSWPESRVFDKNLEKLQYAHLFTENKNMAKYTTKVSYSSSLNIAIT